jgi:hypothetical protein
MNPCELTAAVTAVANSLACRLSDDELSLLSAVFVQLGDTLATILVRKGLCDKYNAKNINDDVIV